MAQNNALNILKRARAIPDFVDSAISSDLCGDWSLARDLGSCYVEIWAEDVHGRLLLAKSCRHLGDLRRAPEELAFCRKVLESGASEVEREVFLPIVEEQERLLASRMVVYRPDGSR